METIATTRAAEAEANAGIVALSAAMQDRIAAHEKGGGTGGVRNLASETNGVASAADVALEIGLADGAPTSGPCTGVVRERTFRAADAALLDSCDEHRNEGGWGGASWPSRPVEEGERDAKVGEAGPLFCDATETGGTSDAAGSACENGILDAASTSRPDDACGRGETFRAADAALLDSCDEHRNEGEWGEGSLSHGSPGEEGVGAGESADPYRGFQPGHGRDWDLKGRVEQKPPPGNWRTWLIMGGRGSGKTRAGAEWVHAIASFPARSDLRIALVAETLGDAREVMIDGASGICRIARQKCPTFEISRRRLVWPNGAVAQIFSSEDPEALRGPQFHYAWCDELGKWKHAEETFDMLQFGLRLGLDPRQLVTTTPRSVPVLKRLIGDPSTQLVRISTRGNAENLAPGFIEALERRYGGTRLGRQELGGELIEDREDALWRRADIEACVIPLAPPLRRIVVAVDPPAGIGAGSCCGIVVAGIEPSGRAVVLADCSVEGATPAAWATAVVKAYRRFEADRVVAEVNQGGEMVTAMLRSIDVALPVTMVRATRGKFARAEPVAALYEQARVAHAGRFAVLEDQMCDFGPDGLSTGRSPDRLDALVWALTALVLEAQGEPRVRGV